MEHITIIGLCKQYLNEKSSFTVAWIHTYQLVLFLR